MKTVPAVIWAAVVTVVMAMSCGKKTPLPPALVFGSDTLRTEQLVRFDPVATDEPVKLRNVGVRLICASGLPESGADTLVPLFTERLLLVTGVEWGEEGAALLLAASKRLYEMLQQSCPEVDGYIDSLRTRLPGIVTAPSGAAPLPAVVCTGTDTGASPVQLRTADYLQKVLGVQPECADLIEEFLTGQDTEQTPVGAGDARKVISGLLAGTGPPADSANIRKQVSRSSAGVTHRAPAESHDNSEAVLQYRNRESIRDSIQKHIPDLRQLYKKSLKGGKSFDGTVVVTIRVNAAGAVIHAAIRASDIDNKVFLDPFVAYVRTIRFKPVPEKLGAMTFDFPFEFNAEM